MHTLNITRHTCIGNFPEVFASYGISVDRYNLLIKLLSLEG